MQIEGFLCIFGKLPAQRTLIAGMKGHDADGDRTLIDAKGVNARRSIVGRSQERGGHARETDGTAGSLWPLQLSLLNSKGRVCA